MKTEIEKEDNLMARPTAKDFEEWTHDCWGVSSKTIRRGDYIIALNKYIDYLENRIKL